MFLRCLLVVLSSSALNAGAEAPVDRYAGTERCASCHKAIYETQGKTAMAHTWRGTSAAFKGLSFDEKTLHYEVRAKDHEIEFSVSSGGKEKLSAPVRAMIGGERHGISFLLGLDELGGIALERPALVQARYALSQSGALILSPGFPKETSGNREYELGEVMSPRFEVRCLTCHGKPETPGAGKLGGVRCESCHGPAAEHVSSVTTAGQQIVKPKSLQGAEGMKVCGECHSGLSAKLRADPMPEDLLVSNQVPALRHSECFIQSGEGKLTCTSCHDPHADSPAVPQTSNRVCLACHALSVQPHAAVCPINRTQGCVGCHMPAVQSDSFRLTDHWIRVHPEPGAKLPARDESLRSQIIPQREYLRVISVASDEQMKAVTDRLAKGESFGAVALDLSIEPSAADGGFIGDVALEDMDPKVAEAARHLRHGEHSAVIQAGSRKMMLQRLARDFKWQADELFGEASALRKQGNLAAASAKNQEALDIYPYFLRGIVLLGVMLEQAGDISRASETLEFAVKSYPQDAQSRFDLAQTFRKQPAKQIEELRRTIELDPDLVVAYQSLGSVLQASGEQAAAIETFRRGLQIDPLSGILYYKLGLALKEQGDSAGAAKALGLAARLDPEIGARESH